MQKCRVVAVQCLISPLKIFSSSHCDNCQKSLVLVIVIIVKINIKVMITNPVDAMFGSENLFLIKESWGNPILKRSMKMLHFTMENTYFICIHSEKKWSQTGASEEPFWKMAPLCKEGPFFPKNSASKALKRLHLEKRGAKIVPQRGLFCGQKRCLWGAVMAPLFFWVYVLYDLITQWYCISSNN